MSAPKNEHIAQPTASVINNIEANLESPGRQSVFYDDVGRDSYLRGLEHVLNKDQTSGLLSSPEAVTDIVDIACRGKLRDHVIVPGARFVAFHESATGPRFPEAILQPDHLGYRKALLGVYLRNPTAAEAIVAGKVFALHGSSSGSLLSILDKGLVPLAALRETELRIATGAKDNWGEGINKSVRFVPFDHVKARQVREYWGNELPVTEERLSETISKIALQIRGLGTEKASEHYKKYRKEALQQELLDLQKVRNFLMTTPGSEEERIEQELITQNFPVVYGCSNEDIDPFKCMAVSSSVHGEFAVKGGVDHKYIKAIFVPRQQQAVVTELVNSKDLDAQVVAIEDIPCFDPMFAKAAN